MTEHESPETGPVQFMSQMTVVDYRLPEVSALAQHIAEAIAQGRVIGLLDGSHSTLGMQRILDLAIAEVHTGLRVEAVWRPEAERRLSGGAGRNLALGEAISGWKPTGEPDAPIEQYADYIV